MVNPSLNRQRM